MNTCTNTRPRTCPNTPRRSMRWNVCCWLPERCTAQQLLLWARSCSRSISRLKLRGRKLKSHSYVSGFCEDEELRPRSCSIHCSERSLNCFISSEVPEFVYSNISTRKETRRWLCGNPPNDNEIPLNLTLSLRRRMWELPTYLWYPTLFEVSQVYE